MRRFIFEQEVQQTLARERFHHPDPRVQQRMEIVWTKKRGQRKGDILLFPLAFITLCVVEQ